MDFKYCIALKVKRASNFILQIKRQINHLFLLFRLLFWLGQRKYQYCHYQNHQADEEISCIILHELHNAQIRDYAVIGMRATISDYSVVGEWAIIGEMGLVKNSQIIPDGVVAVGVPAKVLGKVDKKQKEFWGYGKKLYAEMAHKYITPGVFKRID